MKLPTMHWIVKERFACGARVKGVGYDDKEHFLEAVAIYQGLFGNFCKRCVRAAKKVGE